MKVRYLVGGLLLGMLCGCFGSPETVVIYNQPTVKPGPPPHAPAWGYRKKHPSGVELEFDRDLGVYVVIGRQGIYFWEGFFFKFEGDHWWMAASLEGPWEVAEPKRIPPGLLKKYKCKCKKWKHKHKCKHGPPWED
ncbi:hypothetical protein FVE67_08120 [Thermosulfurimonas marina]|uniref:Uncharacterized protein n=1 Tax=Thermosulfurimonas marina TaxID=2047767 RepID=A0A6H1WUH3_9BACT|nr:hypothetical protein [Thermosulfurimonas marina]QJA06756.1 hypothetical protein FVE67_08120 [Thermosulfurimonas marina]